jgi:hypothetical protein
VIGCESPSTITSSISKVMLWAPGATDGRVPLREVSDPPAADVARSSVTESSVNWLAVIVAATVLSTKLERDTITLAVPVPPEK